MNNLIIDPIAVITIPVMLIGCVIIYSQSNLLLTLGIFLVVIAASTRSTK